MPPLLLYIYPVDPYTATSKGFFHPSSMKNEVDNNWHYIHYSKEQLQSIDWELLQHCSSQFTSTALARFHFYKASHHQWFTEERANKFNSDISPTCRCCNESIESIAQVFACPSRISTHQKYQSNIIKVLCGHRICGSLLKALELGFDLIRSNEPTHRGDYNWRGDLAGSPIYKSIHHFFSDSNVTDPAKHTFSSQTLLGWEDALLGRFAIAWRAVPHHSDWRQPILMELMQWGRGSWTNRCSQLFRQKKDQYRLRRHRLHQEVHLWYDSPLSEVLIHRTSFLERDKILRCNNEGIARWLELQHMRRKEILSWTQQRSGQLSILSFRGTRESCRDNNTAFQMRLQEARRAQLPIPTETPDTSDGDCLLDGRPPTEDPPD